MAFAYSLCSSSKGNSTYIGSKTSGILIDAGLSLRGFRQKMNFIGIEPSAIKGIFITHEHTDHIKGLKAIGALVGAPIYGSRETIESLIEKNLVPVDAEIYEINKKTVELQDICIHAFSTPHDSVHSLGYTMQFCDGKTAAVCTDLGCVTDEVYASITGKDFVLLESNYDEHMLMFGGYPYMLKKRISSSLGHLSNENCADTLVELLNSGTTKFMLGHLSEQNNQPQLAMRSALDALLKTGAQLGRDYILTVAKAQSAGDIVEI